jgi:hypothetical protein
MKETKRECKRIGYKYLEILNQIAWFIDGYPPARDMINDFTREKLQELCIKLETGEYELIEFGNEIKDLFKSEVE